MQKSLRIAKIYAVQGEGRRISESVKYEWRSEGCVKDGMVGREEFRHRPFGNRKPSPENRALGMTGLSDMLNCSWDIRGHTYKIVLWIVFHMF